MYHRAYISIPRVLFELYSAATSATGGDCICAAFSGTFSCKKIGEMGKF